MNPCPEYESQILDYAELSAPARASLDAHLAGCAGCSRFYAALAEVDDALGTAFPSGLELPQAVAARILRQAEPRPLKPSVWPEIFDVVGWASLIAAMVAIAAALATGSAKETAIWAVFALVIVAGSAWFVLEGWRESERY